ncbi:MAG TPA: SRPBCC domain-containing protein [Acidimicrobiia bacterium]|nr:SRPBCC domain-containing protein [Acidimicrobiia bacterium]
MDLLPEVERSIELPATPDEVWERVVEGAFAEEWMGISLEPRPGGNVSVPDREMIGTVEEVVPGESITWSWRELGGEPSQVTIEIGPSETGSTVTVTERLLEYKITGIPPVFLARAA